MHTIARRVLVSGIKNADKAWDNYNKSRMKQRAGARMGIPRRKCKGVSRDSFTVPHETTGAYGTYYHEKDPEYARRKAQLKHRGISAKPTITDYRHVRRFPRASGDEPSGILVLMRAVNCVPRVSGDTTECTPHGGCTPLAV